MAAAIAVVVSSDLGAEVEGEVGASVAEGHQAWAVDTKDMPSTSAPNFPFSKRNKRNKSDPRVLCLSPRTPEEAIALRDARQYSRRAASRNGEALVIVTREQQVLLLKCANFHSLPSTHTHTHTHTQLEATKWPVSHLYRGDVTLEVTTPGDRKEEVSNVDVAIPAFVIGEGIGTWGADGSALDSCRTSLANEVSSGRVLFVGTQSQ